jgi:hypothetical protein
MHIPAQNENYVVLRVCRSDFFPLKMKGPDPQALLCPRALQPRLPIVSERGA